MTTEYGIDLKPTPNYSGNPITIADEMLSSYEILTGKNQPYPKAIVKFDRSLYESESSWSNNTLPEIIDGQSLLSIRDGPYGHFYDYVIAKHTTSDLYVSFECYDSAYLLKTTELSDILLPPVPIGYLDARVPVYFKAVGNLSLFSQYYIFVPTTSLKSTDSSPLIYSADIYLSIPVTRVSSQTSTRYTFCMLHGTIQLMNSSQPDSGVQFLITSIDRFHGDLASLFILCCAFVRRDCFTYLTPQTITTSETYPNNWLLNETVGWSSTPSNFHEESRSLVALSNSPISGLQSVGTFSEKEQYYGYLVVSSSTSTRVQYDYVTAQNVDQIVTIDTTVAYEVAKPAVDFEIRTNEFAASVLTALAESYNMLYFFASVYNTYRRSDGYLLPKTPNTSGYSATNILFTKNMSSLTTDVNYIRNKLLNISPSRTITLDYTNSTVDFLTAPQISNQGTGDLVTSVTVASENYQGSMSYTNAPFRGKSNNIYVPYIDQDNEKGTIEEIQENLTYAKKFLKRIAYNILRSNKADQNMCSYSTQELQPKIISVETLPTSDIDTDAIYAVLDPNTLGETCYKRNGSTWITVTPTFTYSDPFPYDFATIDDEINGKTLTSVPLAALHTRYPECTTTWLWGYPPYLDTEASLNDLTKNSLVGAEQGTENITISENYAAKIIVGDSDPDELPPSDPSTGNRLYDPTNQSLGGFTGLIQERNEDSGIYRLAGYDKGVLQAQFRTDGKIATGGNNIILDADGLSVKYDPSESGPGYRPTDALKFIDKENSNNIPMRVYYDPIAHSASVNSQPVTDGNNNSIGTSVSLSYGSGSVSFDPHTVSLVVDGTQVSDAAYMILSTNDGSLIYPTNRCAISVDSNNSYSHSQPNKFMNHSTGAAIDTSEEYCTTSVSSGNNTAQILNSIGVDFVESNNVFTNIPYMVGCNGRGGGSPYADHQALSLKATYTAYLNQTFSVDNTGYTLEGISSGNFIVNIRYTGNFSIRVNFKIGGSTVDTRDISLANTSLALFATQSITFSVPEQNQQSGTFSFGIEITSTGMVGADLTYGWISYVDMGLYDVVAKYGYVSTSSYIRYCQSSQDIAYKANKILTLSNLHTNGSTDNQKFLIANVQNGSVSGIVAANIDRPISLVLNTDATLRIGVSDTASISTSSPPTCSATYLVQNGEGGHLMVSSSGVELNGDTKIWGGDFTQSADSSGDRGNASFDVDSFSVNSTILTAITSPMILFIGNSTFTNDATFGGNVALTGGLVINDAIAEYLRGALLQWRRVWYSSTGVDSGYYNMGNSLPTGDFRSYREVMIVARTTNDADTDNGFVSSVMPIKEIYNGAETTLLSPGTSPKKTNPREWNQMSIMSDDGINNSYYLTIRFETAVGVRIVESERTKLYAVFVR